MKLALFNPYNLSAPEMPILSLLSAYVTEYGHQVTSLECDGCFPVCDHRIVPESGLKRRLGDCFSCRYDSDIVLGRTGIVREKISTYIPAEDADSTFRWAQTFDFKTISDVTFNGENILWLCRASLKNRYGTVEGGLRLPGIEVNLRNLFLSAARMIKAGQFFMEKQSPDLIFVSGRDFLAESFQAGAKHAQGIVARFAWEHRTKLLNVAHPEKNEVLSLDVSAITANMIVTDSKSWPEEVHELLKEVMLFLEIPSSQLALFAANQEGFA